MFIGYILLVTGKDYGMTRVVYTLLGFLRLLLETSTQFLRLGIVLMRVMLLSKMLLIGYSLFSTWARFC